MKLIIKTFLSLILFSLATVSVNAQGHLSKILKVYPHWNTNFDKKIIDLRELIPGGPPKDGIPAIFNPKYEEQAEAERWVDDREPVIAVEINNEARAYPLSILIWHEIANDKLGNVPIAVTFCPLCYSALVFDRRILGMQPYFGVSGLLRNSDLVMYDNVSESFWQQFTGEAIVGEMVGNKLTQIPSQIISFRQFKNAYPNGSVLSKETGHQKEYGKNPYVGYDDIDQKPFLYRGDEDNRLPPNEKVIAVKEQDVYKAYPYTITFEMKVINDKVGEMPVVIFHGKGAVSALDSDIISESKEVGSTGVFSPSVDSKTLTFIYQDGFFIDNETRSRWDITGKAVSGELKGKQLKKIPHGDYFAFAWFAFMPETEVYKGN